MRSILLILGAMAVAGSSIAADMSTRKETTSKVWFVTGSNRGIGLEIARAALEAGDKVVATTRKPDMAMAELSGYGDNLYVFQLDITDPGQIDAAVAAAREKFGRVDILVNNAAYGQLGYFENNTDQEIRKQFETNLFGSMAVTRAILPMMRQQRSGHVINISSVAGLSVGGGSSIYGSTKFALEGWTEGLAKEIKPLGISATLIEPGYFRTDFLDPSSVSWGSLNIEDYSEAATQGRKGAESVNHQQIGDPAKLGPIVVQLAQMKNPPLRFAAGADAYEVMRKKGSELIDNAEQFRDLSKSTDGSW